MDLNDFFRSQSALVVHTARRFAPHPELVPDIVQQVYLEFLKDAERKNWNLRNEGRPLLYQVTRNVAGKFWRRFRREQPESLREIGELVFRLNEKYDPPTDEQEHLEEIRALRDCLDKLPADHRRLVDLKYYLGTPTGEIADMFQVKQNSVQRALARIRAVLADCIRGIVKNG